MTFPEALVWIVSILVGGYVLVVLIGVVLGIWSIKREDKP